MLAIFQIRGALPLLSLFALNVASAEYLETQPVIDTTIEAGAKEIFLGPESEMPVDGCYRLPLQKSADIPYPGTLGYASEHIANSLPIWIRRAYVGLHPSADCRRITIDGRNVIDRYVEWFLVRWKYSDPTSSLARDLVNAGFEMPRDEHQSLDSLVSGSCIILLSGTHEQVEVDIQNHAARYAAAVEKALEEYKSSAQDE